MRFKEFLVEKHGTTAKVGITFSASIPADSPLYSDVSDEESLKHTLDSAAQSLGETLGKEVNVSAKTKARNKSKWTIMSSEETSSFAHPIQIVSPIEATADILKDLPMVAKWIDSNGLRTVDSDTALVALSVPNINDRLDPAKLVLILDKTNNEQIFSTVNYSPAQLEIILSKLKQTGKLPPSASAILKAAERYLGKRPGGQTNFQNLNDGVIEFKLASGAGYEHDVEQMRAKIARYVRAVEIACDPVLDRSDYLHRLSAALTQRVRSPVTKNDSKSLPQELERLYRFDPEVLSAWKQYSVDSEHGIARIPLMVLVNTAMKAAKAQHETLSSAERQFFKRLMRQSVLQGTDADEYYGSDHMTRLKFKTAFGV